jgi:integrase/recombinase XerC
MVLEQLQALGLTSTAELTTTNMVAYVAHLEAAGVTNPNTVNGYLSAASAVCTFAIEEGLLDRPPVWRRVRPVPAPMVKNLPPDYDDFCRLLASVGARADWVGRRLAALVWTVSLTGMRLREALYAHVDDLGRGRLRIDPRRQRTRRLKTIGSARDVPLPPVLDDLLARWLPDAGPIWLFPGIRRKGPWDGGSANSRPLGQLQAAAAEAGIGHVTWHGLRHAYGTFALSEWQVPLWVVREVMGHGSLRTTEGYLHLRNARKITAAVQGIAVPVRPALA